MKSGVPSNRNFVKKFADEYTKPSRHRDRKHDYVRNHKHRDRQPESAEVPKAGPSGKPKKHLRTSEDWCDYPDLIGVDPIWFQPEEDTPPTGEIQ